MIKLFNKRPSLRGVYLKAAPQFTLIKEDDIDIKVKDDILVVD